ncbi:MAG TPA: hypothetical protein VFA86_06530 [Gammaproteobacteria bacterium]|nr:hypothetical protein [Gammaproteobacteria bacterium]
MYSDEYLEHYAERFLRDRLGAHGVTLVQYLADPARYEHLTERHEPLLPRQRLVQRQVYEAEMAQAERGVETLPRRNGAIVEPLHHRRFPVANSMFRGRS